MKENVVRGITKVPKLRSNIRYQLNLAFLNFTHSTMSITASKTVLAFILTGDCLKTLSVHGMVANGNYPIYQLVDKLR